MKPIKEIFDLHIFQSYVFTETQEKIMCVCIKRSVCNVYHFSLRKIHDSMAYVLIHPT